MVLDSNPRFLLINVPFSSCFRQAAVLVAAGETELRGNHFAKLF